MSEPDGDNFNNSDEKPDECQSCEFETEALTFWPNPGYGISKPVWLCQICSGSEAGHAVMYPTLDSSRANAVVLRQIAYVGNVLLEAIRANKSST